MSFSVKAIHPMTSWRFWKGGDTQRPLAIQKPRDLMVEFNILGGERVGATGIVRNRAPGSPCPRTNSALCSAGN
jgi:hypothetical protein